eukprot:365063-Chlamydomonas_euryale.AAC.10
MGCCSGGVLARHQSAVPGRGGRGGRGGGRATAAAAATQQLHGQRVDDIMSLRVVASYFRRPFVWGAAC